MDLLRNHVRHKDMFGTIFWQTVFRFMTALMCKTCLVDVFFELQTKNTKLNSSWFPPFISLS